MNNRVGRDVHLQKVKPGSAQVMHAKQLIVTVRGGVVIRSATCTIALECMHSMEDIRALSVTVI